MNITFLDVDGVLTTEKHIIEQYYKNGNKPSSGYKQEFDPICMQNLKEFINETNSNIVISSTWRLGDHNTDKGWITLMDRLNDYGLKNRVIGCTPRIYDVKITNKYGSYCCRGYEIQKWLDENTDNNIEKVNFVILDDDTDMFHLINKLAKCSFKTGFTQSVKEKAISIIKGE